MKTGRQDPTYSVIGEYAYSYGSEVVDMFEDEGGATFYPSQKQELELMLARNKNGEPTALTIGISKPRQNGKSYAARYYAVYMSVFEHRQVLYSAHHSTTTNKMFNALCNLFESPERYPDFAADVKEILAKLDDIKSDVFSKITEEQEMQPEEIIQTADTKGETVTGNSALEETSETVQESETDKEDVYVST